MHKRRLLPTTLPLRHPSSSLIFRVNSQRAAAHVTSPLDPNSLQELALLRSSDLRSVGVHKTLSAFLITDTCLRALRRYAPPVEGGISPASKQRLLPARRQAFLHAILRGFTRHQAHTFDCHATVVPSGLQPQAPGMCLPLVASSPSRKRHAHDLPPATALPGQETPSDQSMVPDRSGVTHGFFGGAWDGAAAAQVIWKYFACASFTSSTDHHSGTRGAAGHQRPSSSY